MKYLFINLKNTLYRSKAGHKAPAGPDDLLPVDKVLQRLKAAKANGYTVIGYMIKDSECSDKQLETERLAILHQAGGCLNQVRVFNPDELDIKFFFQLKPLFLRLYNK